MFGEQDSKMPKIVCMKVLFLFTINFYLQWVSVHHKLSFNQVLKWLI